MVAVKVVKITRNWSKMSTSKLARTLELSLNISFWHFAASILSTSASKSRIMPRLVESYRRETRASISQQMTSMRRWLRSLYSLSEGYATMW